ncbi:Heph, partial [Symbiodinium microadriaticum]
VLLKRYPYDFRSHTCSWDDNFYADASTRNGFMGPILRAVVGDTLVVHFLNRAFSVYSAPNGSPRPEFNLLPEGLRFEVDVNRRSAGYGEEVVYQWEAHASSGPGESGTKQFSSNLWMYSSAVAPVADINAGLIGGIVVVDSRFITTAAEKSSASPCDVDWEVFVLAAKIDETKSWLWRWNQQNLTTDMPGNDDDNYDATDHTSTASLNTVFSFNGLAFGNYNPDTGLSLPEKSRVRWNVLAYSRDSSLSAVPLVWEGHTLTNAQGNSLSSLRLNSPGTAIADMFTGRASSASWLLRADREDCVAGGLSAIFSVETRRVSGQHGEHYSSIWGHTYYSYQLTNVGNNEVTFLAGLISVVAVVGMVVLYIKAVRSGVLCRKPVRKREIEDGL